VPTHAMTFRLPEDLLERLDTVAAKNRRSRTQQILHYIDEGLASTPPEARSTGASRRSAPRRSR
jgi:metal-responsive CopG/Arc/MetJ family transcriptional regulator